MKWTTEEIAEIEELREVIENRPDEIYNIASDENFELNRTDGFYQRLAMSVAYLEGVNPKMVLSPDKEDEYTLYFYLNSWAVYVFPIDPNVSLPIQVHTFFANESGLPKEIWGALYNRSSVEISQVR